MELVREGIFGLVVTPHQAKFMKQFQTEWLKIIENKPLLKGVVKVEKVKKDGPN